MNEQSDFGPVLSISYGGTGTPIVMIWYDYMLDPLGSASENNPPQNIPLLLKNIETDVPYYVVGTFDGENFTDDMGETIDTKYIQKYSIIRE